MTSHWIILEAAVSRDYFWSKLNKRKKENHTYFAMCSLNWCYPFGRLEILYEAFSQRLSLFSVYFHLCTFAYHSHDLSSFLSIIAYAANCIHCYQSTSSDILSVFFSWKLTVCFLKLGNEAGSFGEYSMLIILSAVIRNRKPPPSTVWLS